MAEDFEQIALTLLLCTPSELNRAWAVEQPDLEKINEILSNCKFKDPQKMLATMGKGVLFEDRFLFRAVADTLKNQVASYGGSDAHPGGTQSVALVKVIQAIG